MEKIVVWESCGDYYFTTLRNYKSYIQDARKIHRFSKSDFENINEFAHFIATLLKVLEEDIETVR